MKSSRSQRRMKLFSIVFSFLLCLPLLLPPASIYANDQTTVSSDIHGHWAEGILQDWITKGIIQPDANGFVHPGEEVTRIEMIKMINTLFGFTEEADIAFSDSGLSSDMHHQAAIAVQAGFVSGYGDGAIRPSALVSRQEAAVMMVRLFQSDTAMTSHGLDKFSDRGEIAGWSREAVAKLVALKIMNGYPDDTFRPRGAMTRAEAAVTIHGAYQVAAADRVFSEAGTYGPERGIEIIQGNVIVQASGITLRNMIIRGDLQFSEGIGSGDASLNGVTVQGTTMVNGGGENSIHFIDSVLVNIVVNKAEGTVRIVAEGSTIALEVVITSSAIIENVDDLADHGFANIVLSEQLAGGSDVTLHGTFDQVDVHASEANLKIVKGAFIVNLNVHESASNTMVDVDAEAEITHLILNAVVEILGQGTITHATINDHAQGSEFAQWPANLDGSQKDNIQGPSAASTPQNSGNEGNQGNQGNEGNEGNQGDEDNQGNENNEDNQGNEGNEDSQDNEDNEGDEDNEVNLINILSNAGFEDGIVGWNAWGTFDFTEIPADVYTGNRAARAYSTGAAGGGNYVIHTSISEDTEFILSAFGKRGTGTPGWAMLNVELRDSDDQVIGAVESTFATYLTWDNPEYEEKSATFIAPAGTASIHIGIYLDANATDLYVDDIMLAMTNGGTPPDMGGEVINLMANPGFENDFDGWWTTLLADPPPETHKVAITEDANDVHSGLKAAQFMSDGYAVRSIQVEEQTTYTFSAWGKRADSQGTITFDIHALDADDAAIGDKVGSLAWSELEYTEKSITFTTPEGTKALRFTIYLGIGSADLYLDDLSLVESEEVIDPGSVGIENPNPTTYYVAVDGNDEQDGSLNQPFRTIQHAASLAQSGDTVFIREGIYYETVTPAHSGTEAQPIIYKAYEDEEVILSGLEPIEAEWSLHDTHIYTAQVDLTMGSKNSIFVNGELMKLARWPNADAWLDKTPALVNNAASSPTTLIPSTTEGPSMPDLDWTGAKVWTYVNWFGWTSTIQAYNPATQALTIVDHAPDAYTQLGFDSVQATPRYYIYNSLHALDAPKEWYYDEVTSTLYLYIPEGADPSDEMVEKREREVALSFNNRSYIQVEDLHIIGATIQGNDIHHVKFDRLTMSDFGYDSDSVNGYGSQSNIGIVLVGDGIEFSNSEMFNSSGGGLRILGNDAVIYNNYIHDIGYSGTFTVGLTVDGHNAHIAYNTITRTGAGCIGGNLIFGGLIEYNDFSYCGMVSVDNGTLHFAKNDYQNTEIRYNNFHNGQDGAGYIYLDNGSSNVIIHHNNVYDRFDGGQAVLINQPANYIQFYNNMIQGSIMSSWGWVFQDDTYRMSVYDNVFTDGMDITGPAEVYNNSTSPDDYEMLVFPDGPAGHDFNRTAPQPDRVFSNHPQRNLVKNAGFEGMINNFFVANDLRDWEKIGDMNVTGQLALVDSMMLDDGYTRTGNGSARIADQSGLQQVITGLEPNMYYEFAGWIKVNAGEEGLIGVKDFDDNNSDYFDIVEDTEEGWQRHIHIFKTGAASTGATVYVSKSTTGAGHVYMDDLGLVLLGETLPDPPAPKPGENLLSNEGFESGEQSWTELVNVEGVDEPVYRGARALAVHDGGSVTQTVSLGITAQTDYMVSAWGKVAAGQSGSMLVRSKDADGQYITEDSVVSLNFTETEYTRKSVKYTTPDGTASVEIKFLNEGDAETEFYVDETAIRQSVNLIPNGGFEDSSQPIGFIAVQNMNIIENAEDVHSGSRALHMTSSDEPKYAYGHTFITIGVTENTKYQLSAWGKRGEGESGVSFLALGYQSEKEVEIEYGCEGLEGNELVLCQQASQISWTEMDYTQKTLTFTTKPGTKLLKMAFWLPGDAADWYADELSLYEIEGVTTDPTLGSTPDPGDPVDLSALNSAITTAVGVRDNAIVGTDAGEYPQTAMDDLEAAILTAQAVVADSDAVQAQIDTAVSALNAAVVTFEAAVNVDSGMTNLLPNASFEDGLVDWDAWGTIDITNNPADVNTGNQAARAYSTGEAGGASYVINTDITEDTTLNLSAYGKRGADGAGWAMLNIVLRDTANDVIGAVEGDFAAILNWGGSDYEEKSVTFTAPAGTATIHVGIYLDPDGADLFLDDIVLMKIVDEEGDVSNLVSDPGFESGVDGLENWVSWGNLSTVTDSVYSGNRAARVVGAGGGAQVITSGINENTAYTVSAWGKRGLGEGEAFLTIKCKDADGTHIDGVNQAMLYWTGTAYDYQSATFTTPASTVSIELSLWANGGAADLYVDDIVLTRS